jgi:uncharacterized protein
LGSVSAGHFYVDARIVRVVWRRRYAIVKYQIKRTSNNQYRFNIIASNGQVLATSETYVAKASAKSAVESIKKNAASASTEDLT